MKIISGLYKGRNLLGYDIKGTRPTMDRVKESLFASIQSYLKDSVVLDLFAGSGNLAIEALSNGAKYAYLVDNSSQAIKIIKKNIENLQIENSFIINLDYEKALEKLSGKKLDIIFLDPPYNTDYIEKAISLINKFSCLREEGLIICESDALEKIVYPDNYQVWKSKKYGDKWVVILKQM